MTIPHNNLHFVAILIIGVHRSRQQCPLRDNPEQRARSCWACSTKSEVSCGSLLLMLSFTTL